MKSRSSWAQSGNLITGSRSPITCQANLGKDLGDVYTIQFGITLPPPGFVVRPEATLSFTVNGNEVIRRISVNDGTSVSGTAEFFKVHLYDALTAGMPGVLGLQYAGNIQISKGVRPAVQQPPYLTPDTYTDSVGVVHPYVGMVTVPAAAVFTVPVPVNAGVISALVKVPPLTPPFATTPQVYQVSAAGLMAIYDPTLYDYVSLFPGTNLLHLVASAGNNTDFAVLFGVDG